MANKVYSKLDSIPTGETSDKITKGCLVLEGGAFRALYTEGVLDVLMQNDINFECVVGVSAGALNGCSYLAGQIGRAALVNLTYRHDERYVGPKAFIKNKGVIGFDFIMGELPGIPSLNTDRLFDKKRRLIACASNLKTAKTTYFDSTKDDPATFFLGVQASATMPYISRPVMINDMPYLDGGCIKKIPYEWALKEGFDKIVVVRTRNLDFRKKPNYERRRRITKLFYPQYKKFNDCLAHSHDGYNAECEEILKLMDEKRIFCIAPSEPVTIGRLEKDMEKLGDLYHLGRKDALAALEELKKYIEE